MTKRTPRYIVTMGFERDAWDKHLHVVLRSEQLEAADSIVQALRRLGWHLLAQQIRGGPHRPRA